MEEKSIFEGAKFGDKFVSINNKSKIYLFYSRSNVICGINYEYDHSYELLPYSSEHLFVEEFDDSGNGLYNHDTVVKYHEEIDEEKLDELAAEYLEGVFIDKKIVERFQDKITLLDLLKGFYRKTIE